MKKTKYIIRGLIATLLLTLSIVSCESYNEALLEDIGTSREFSPIDLTAKVRNQTTVELDWTVEEDTNHYVIEFSADDPNFTTIYKTVEVSPSEVPVQIQLEGETLYSIRVKAVSANGKEDSKWSVTTANTLSEQIFLTPQNGDIKATEVTLRWVENSNVTQIKLVPGDIVHTITAEEKAAGIAKITGLTSETDYNATLFNGTKKRGALAFETGIDIGDGILVTEADDLAQKIADAPDGSVLVLESGDYTAQTGTINLDKPITIRGLKSYDKPLLKVSFSINTGASEVSLIDLDLTGDANSIDVIRYSSPDTYTSLKVSGCNIHDFDRSFIAGSVSNAKVSSVTIDNCVLTNVRTGGGDFIDFRNTHVENLAVTNSTFNNCAIARDFLRIDRASGFSGTGLTTTVLIDRCTFYSVSNTSGKRILYIRFDANDITIKNSLFAETVAIYSNQSDTSVPTFLNNNYFNADGLSASTNVIFDGTSTFTTIDPEFEDVASGNFTINNQILKDENVGDPRWIK